MIRGTKQNMAAALKLKHYLGLSNSVRKGNLELAGVLLWLEVDLVTWNHVANLKKSHESIWSSLTAEDKRRNL